jgi:transposase
VKEHDTRLWRILNHYVSEARAEADFSSVKEVGVDETSSRRGHNYVTLFVTECKEASTLSRFKKDLESHKAHRKAIEEV